MEQVRQQYSFKRDTRKMFTTIVPVSTYFILLLFTILSELISVKFDWKLVLSLSFFYKLAYKYFIVMAVLFLAIPFFVDLLKGMKEALQIKKNAIEMNNTFVTKRLSYDFRLYTKQEMKVLEKEFFEELLSGCGNIDYKYLTWSLETIKQEYKRKVINKSQYKVLKSIKTGKITFAKLNGDELKYVGTYDIEKNKMYKDSSKNIILDKAIYKIISMFIIALLIQLFLDSLADGYYEVLLKDGKLLALTRIITSLITYFMSTYYAYRTARKVVNEQLRFTEAVTIFAGNYLELVASGNRVIETPKQLDINLETFTKEEDKVIEETKGETKDGNNNNASNTKE